jgi:hypothetical protein
VKSLAVFDTPALPDGWEGRDVVRIVDPLGLGVAWFDAGLAGLCVGFFARAGREEAWIPVLESVPPGWLDQPGGPGCEILWISSRQEPEPARLAGSSWSFVTRDPTAVTVSGTIGGVSAGISARFDDGALVLTADSSPGAHGQFGFRVHLRDVEIVTCEGARVDLGADRFPAVGVSCAGSTTMHARWERLAADGRVTGIEWMPAGREHPEVSVASLTILTA